MVEDVHPCAECPHWLALDPIAASLIRSGVPVVNAFAAVERAAIEREGMPLNEMYDAIITNRELDRINRKI